MWAKMYGGLKLYLKGAYLEELIGKSTKLKVKIRYVGTELNETDI